MKKEKFVFRFEKLTIWILSIDLSVRIYQLSSRFPDSEKYGIVNQLRRSANSVSANIAEGSSRISDKDMARFIQLSYGSLMETMSFLALSNRLEYLSQEELISCRTQIIELSKKLNAFHRSLRT